MSGTPGTAHSRLAAHTVLSMVAVLSLGLTRLIFSLLVGRADEFGPAVLGSVNTQLSIATFASLAFASTSVAASKFVSAALGAGDESQARRALLALLRWCVFGTIAVTVVLALALSLLFGELSLAQVTATCLLFVAYSGYVFVRGAQYGYGTVRRYTVIETVCDALAIALAVLVVILGADLLLLMPFIVGYALFTIVGWIGLPRPPRGPAPALRRDLRHEMRGYAAWGGMGILASTGFLQLSMIFAFAFNSNHDAGLYAAAFNLTVPALFLPRALSMALFPSMAGAFGRGDSTEVRRQVDAGTRFLLVGGLPFFAAAMFFAEPILDRSFGREFSDAHLALEILLTATYVLVVGIPAVNAFSATERRAVRIPAMGSVAGLVVGMIVWSLLGPSHGIEAIAVGYLAGVLATSGNVLVAGWRRWRLPWSMLFLRVGAVIGVAGALRLLADQTDNGLLVRLACTLAVAVATALICFPEVRQILARVPAMATQARSVVSR